MNINWRDQAACLDADPEIFYITGARATPHERAAEAAPYCRRCPVADACWQNAADNRDVDVYRAGVEIRRPIPVCVQCHIIFTPARKRNASTRYCSDPCRDAWQAENARKAAERAVKAEANAKFRPRRNRPPLDTPAEQPGERAA